MSHYLNYPLSAEDVDVLLAALRLLQRTAGWDIPDAIQQIGGESLDVVNIDRLCERLNLDGQADTEDERDGLIKRIRAELSRPEWDSDTAANLATTLADAGWQPFFPQHEGWYLDVIDGAYTVVARCEGPFRSNAEAMASIARQFAAGSRRHGQVLETIGMTACGHGLPLLRIVGFAPNGHDVLVANERRPEFNLEVGPRSDLGVWSIFRRDSQSTEAQWVADRRERREAIEFCADRLGVVLNDEIYTSFTSHFD